MHVTGTVEENIESRLSRDQPVDCGVVGNIQDVCGNRAVFLGEGCQRSSVDVGRQNYPAFPRESQSALAADTRACPGNQTAFALEPAVHGVGASASRKPFWRSCCQKESGIVAFSRAAALPTSSTERIPATTL